MVTVKLTEILDKKVDYKINKQTYKEFQASGMIGDREISFYAHKNIDGDNTWHITFLEIIEKNGKTLGTYAATKSGHELEVFSMIKDCMLDLIKHAKPDAMLFSANKDAGK